MGFEGTFVSVGIDRVSISNVSNVSKPNLPFLRLFAIAPGATGRE
jgi:hypothetical protein